MLDEHSSNLDILPENSIISGRYRILKVLGSGGMGSVYLAEDQVLEGNHVALKVLHKDFARDPNVTKRFLREVQLMHSVNHLNVVRTFDVGRDGDHIYFTMEYIKGRPLDEALPLGKADMTTIARAIVQICDGLDAIHSADIVHRDLKPGNVMVLENGILKITDFGVARPQSSQLTQHNEIIGSVDYMAPEVWLGQPLKPPVDLYSLGVITYELVTGQLPFEADQPATLMWMHVKRPPAPPVSLRSDIPNWMNQFILKLLAKTPEERYKSARDAANFIRNHAKKPNESLSGGIYADFSFTPDMGSSQRTVAGTGTLNDPLGLPGVGDTGKISSIQMAQMIATASVTNAPRVNRSSRRGGSSRFSIRRLAASLPVLLMGIAFIGIFLFVLTNLIGFIKDLLLI